MRSLLVALLLVSASVVATTPVASACPDPDNPCDPPPYDPLPDCKTYPGPTGTIKGLLLCLLG